MSRDQGTAGLAAFTASREPGDRNSGLFWAACRAAQDGLDTGPVADAAAAAGLGEAEIQHTIASAQATIARARKDHKTVHPR